MWPNSRSSTTAWGTKSETKSRERYRRVSGRNQLAGKVVSIRVEGLLAEVVLAVGDSHMTAIITANAVRELQLKKGDTAAALVKSTDVLIERLQTSRLIRTKTKSS